MRQTKSLLVGPSLTLLEVRTESFLFFCHRMESYFLRKKKSKVKKLVKQQRLHVIHKLTPKTRFMK